MFQNALVVAGEATVVGLCMIVFAYIASLLVGSTGLFAVPALPSGCAQWNKNHMMEATLFVAGFLYHVAFAAAGLKRYE